MIIVTGASRGIGKIICQRLLAKNQKILGLARNIDSLNFDAVSCDVSSYDQLKQIALQIKKTGVPVTGLINAAGIASMNLAVTTPPKVTQNIIHTNLLGTIYACQIFAPLIIRNRGGSIINFSTIAVSLGLKGESIYVASKAGVEGFTRSFAREMADFGIKVNCLAPGPIDTSLLKGVSSDQIMRIVDQQIIPFQFEPSDVADLVEILIDPRSSSLSGQVFNIGGV